jgi:hypothetical protein
MSTDKSVKSTEMAVPDFSKWEEEQVGFAPYWNPEPLKWFLGRVVARDERDPDFVRYLMRAELDTPCKRGPVNDAEDVMIRKGEFFSISVYHSLEGLFNTYLEIGVTPAMKVTAVKEVPTKKSGQTCWTWKVQISPEDKKLLNKKRADLQLEAKRENEKRLSESNDAFPPS